MSTFLGSVIDYAAQKDAQFYNEHMYNLQKADTFYRDQVLHGYNKELQNIAYAQNLEQWKRENEYNSPSAQMQRYKDAGLNPNLIYGQSNLSARSPQLSYSPASNSPMPQIPYRNGSTSFGGVNFVQDIADILTFNNRLRESNSQANLLGYQSEIAKQQALSLTIENAYKNDLLSNQVKQGTEGLAKIRTEVAKLNQDILSGKASVAESNKRLGLIDAQIGHYAKQNGLIDAQIGHYQADTSFLNSRLNDFNIRNNYDYKVMENSYIPTFTESMTEYLNESISRGQHRLLEAEKIDDFLTSPRWLRKVLQIMGTSPTGAARDVKYLFTNPKRF